VQLVDAPPANPKNHSAYIGIVAPLLPDRFELSLVCRDVREYAFELFGFFRICDRANIKTIYCEFPTPDGIGAALADRLRRASEAPS
jgi:L-threonylcarbamoyladenylate synthase